MCHGSRLIAYSPKSHVRGPSGRNFNPSLDRREGGANSQAGLYCKEAQEPNRQEEGGAAKNPSSHGETVGKICPREVPTVENARCLELVRILKDVSLRRLLIFTRVCMSTAFWIFLGIGRSDDLCDALPRRQRRFSGCGELDIVVPHRSLRKVRFRCRRDEVAAISKISSDDISRRGEVDEAKRHDA